MSTPVRLVVFLGVLAAVLVAGLGLGRAVGPIGPASSTESHGADDTHADDGAHAEQPTGVTGLAVSADGSTLRPTATTLAVGTQDFRFTVTGPDGAPVTSYDATHERDVHPDGVLATGPQIAFQAEAPSDGRYRLFLQFQHGGEVRTAAFTADTEETS